MARKSDEDVDYDTDESNARPSLKKCKLSYKQKFRFAWLQLPEFKEWLKAPQGESKPTCSICSTSVPCSKSGIERHGKSAGHMTKNGKSAGHMTKSRSIKSHDFASSQAHTTENKERKSKRKLHYSQQDREMYKDEPERKISKQMMNLYKLEHSDHETVVLRSLANDERFMDVTLTAEGKAVKAHKSVLSAMSSYFQRVLADNPCQHPIIVMPRDISFDELKNIIMYIYRGELSVLTKDLSSLLKTARALEIAGLSELDIEEPEESHSGDLAAYDEHSVTVEAIDEDADATISTAVVSEEQPVDVTPNIVPDEKARKRGRPSRKRIPQKKPKVEPASEPEPPATEDVDKAQLTPEINETTFKRVRSPRDLQPPPGSVSAAGQDLVLSNPDPANPDYFDAIHLFMCECGTVFVEQALLDKHKKGCSGHSSKLKRSGT